MPCPGADRAAPQPDFKHPSIRSAHENHVSLLHRALDEQDEAANHIVHQILQTEPDPDSQGPKGDLQHGEIEAQGFKRHE